jgi:hypothetical protein
MGLLVYRRKCRINARHLDVPATSPRILDELRRNVAQLEVRDAADLGAVAIQADQPAASTQTEIERTDQGSNGAPKPAGSVAQLHIPQRLDSNSVLGLIGSANDPVCCTQRTLKGPLSKSRPGPRATVRPAYPFALARPQGCPGRTYRFQPSG